MSQDSAMVGPTASVLTPCDPHSRRTAPRATRRASRLRILCGFLLSVTVLMPGSSPAQGPQGPYQQVGHHDGGSLISRHLHPQPIAPYPPSAARVSYEYIPPDNRGGHVAALGDTARQLWYRLEYLNWTIEAPGDYPLGARRLSGNEAGPFDAVDVIADGFATQPDAREFDLNKNNGLRFSIGAATPIGDLEANVWALDQADGNIRQEPIRRFDLAGDPADLTIPNFFAATILTSDGALSDTTMLLYDQGYQASLKTDVFGTEASFVFNPLTPNQPLSIRPIVGFQYIRYRENLLIAGSDERDAMDPADPTATVIFDRRIDVRAQNNVYAPEIGVRAQFDHEWFSIGVTPKFLLGFNRRDENLRTTPLLVMADPINMIESDAVRQEKSATEFSPGFDLRVDAKVHLNEHFSLFAGYNLYVLSNISRPTSNVNYDTDGGTRANLSINDSKQHQLWFGGLTVGGELRFH